jgi:hypothetical protein
VNDHRILAIALTPGEVALVVRAVRTYRTRELGTKADVLRMLANALSERDRAWLGMSPMVETQAVEEVAS